MLSEFIMRNQFDSLHKRALMVYSGFEVTCPNCDLKSGGR